MSANMNMQSRRESQESQNRGNKKLIFSEVEKGLGQFQFPRPSKHEKNGEMPKLGY